MNLDHLRDHVAANTDLTVGETLFTYHMPHGVEAGALMLTEASGAWVDHEVPGRYRHRLQVIVRDPDYDAGETRAYELHALLWTEQHFTVGNQTFEWIRPLGLPVPFRRSEGDITEWSINFRAGFYVT